LPQDEPAMTDEQPANHDHSGRAPAWHSTDVLRTAALVMAMYVAARLVWFASPLVLTAFLGVLFGLAVSAGVDRLTPLGVRRGLAAGFVVFVFFALLVGFGTWMAPTLREQAVELQARLPEAVDRLQSWIDARRAGFVGRALGAFSTEARGGFPNATGYLFPFITSTIGAIAGVLVIIFLSIYIAADPNLYHGGIMRLFPHRARKRAGEVLTAMATVLRKWLVTQLIAMATIGAVTTIALLLLRVKAAVALGILAGLLEFIPTVGPIISSVPAVAMGFLDSPEKAVYVTIVYVGLHFAESHVVIPLLMKGGIDLPPAMTILSQALMALLFGFLGLMCAVPLVAATTVAVRMLYIEDVVGSDDGAAPSSLS
jgi:predicted PurR-regulated permease PerM